MVLHLALCNSSILPRWSMVLQLALYNTFGIIGSKIYLLCTNLQCTTYNHMHVHSTKSLALVLNTFSIMRSYLFVIVCGGRGLEWLVCLCVCVTGFVCLFLHHIHVVVTVSVFANMMNLSMSVTYCITHCNTLCVYLHTLDRWHWGASALYNCPHSGPVDPLVIRHQLPAPPRIKDFSKYHMMPIMVFTLKVSKFRPSRPSCHQTSTPSTTKN